MRIAYFADDGAEFETKKECEEYEAKFVAPLKDIVALDEHDEILPYSEECDFFNEVKFLYFKNSDAVDAFHNEMGRVGWLNEYTRERGDYFNENTLYYYDDDLNEFVDVKGSIKYHSDKAKKLNAGKALIEKAIKA